MKARTPQCEFARGLCFGHLIDDNGSLVTELTMSTQSKPGLHGTIAGWCRMRHCTGIIIGTAC